MKSLDRRVKKRGDTGKHFDQQSETSIETQTHQGEESLPMLDSPSVNKKPTGKKRRQSTSTFTTINKATSETTERRSASTSGQQTMLPEFKAVPELQKNSDFNVPSQIVESE